MKSKIVQIGANSKATSIEQGANAIANINNGSLDYVSKEKNETSLWNKIFSILPKWGWIILIGLGIIVYAITKGLSPV
jgi:Zn-dependent alcohol dehydrogenase